MASTTFESLFGGGLDPQLKRMVALSAAAHFIFAALFLLLGRSPQLPVDYRPAIQVALVDLPAVKDLKDVKLGAPRRKQLPPPQQRKPDPSKAKKAKADPPKKKVFAVEEEKKTRKRAVDSKKKKEAAARAKKKRAAARLREQNTAVARLRQRSLDTAMPEGSAAGNVRGTGAIQALAYDAHVMAILKDNWEVPNTFFGQNLHTQVFLKLNRMGRIIEWRIVRGSGNSVYDDTVYRAFRKIEMRQEFPQPDPEVYESILKKGYIIDMHPEAVFSGATR
jgi:outer membrane biosynthesis protein TonB